MAEEIDSTGNNPTTTTEPPQSSPPTSHFLLHARRAPFEYGLLPIPKLIFTDSPPSTLTTLKTKLATTTHSTRVNADTISDVLQISLENASLVVETLRAVLEGGEGEGDDGMVDVNDLVLFLYVQNYKRILPRTHKDSAVVSDVWPSTSAFDGFLSQLSPLQLARSNSRRFMPSPADEEAHQLSYIQKHLANILSLLAESAEGSEDEESLVLSQERFEHLGFLIQFREKGSEAISLSHAAPFFANSDPEMPAVPVLATQVHDWITQNIATALEHIAEKVSFKDNAPSPSDQDVAMNDDSSNSSSGVRNLCFVEGISKTSVVRKSSDFKGSSVKVLNCHDSVIYILAPLKYATIYGCSDATIVLGAIGKAVRVEHCERVQVITAAKRICIANCRECVFFLGVNQKPLILGDNHKLQVAPYNTYYAQLEAHMSKVGVDATINKWNEPLVLGMVDPHDSLSHPAGVSDVQAESPTCYDPEQFVKFLIPNWYEEETSEPTTHNPFSLPELYLAAQQKRHENLVEIKQALQDVQLEESKKRELASALHVYFKDWLYTSGNIRQLYCVQSD